jgi:hypothetical protein
MTTATLTAYHAEVQGGFVSIHISGRPLARVTVDAPRLDAITTAAARVRDSLPADSLPAALSVTLNGRAPRGFRDWYSGHPLLLPAGEEVRQ